MIARRVVARGRVQGVGFRYAMLDAAQAADVDGWVRNLRDGSVEALLQGEPAAVDQVVAWARRGPPAARVAALDVAAVEPDSRITTFELRATA